MGIGRALGPWRLSEHSRLPVVLYGLTLALIVALGSLLRLHGIGSLPLNMDEGATAYFAHLPLSDLWGAPAWLETNPPLFYTVEHYIVLLLGEDAGTLRLASAIAGVLCIPVAAFIARRLGGYAAGIAAALLVATSATNIVSSQDARAYSPFTLAALVAIATEIWLVDVYRYPNHPPSYAWRGGAWASYTIASVIALYLHDTAALMFLALNMVAALCWVSILKMQHRFVVHWIAANVVIAAFYAFWLPVIVYQSAHTLANFWLPVPTLRDLYYAMMNIYAQPYMRVLQPVTDLLFLSVGLAGIVFYRSNRILLGLAILVVFGVPTLSWLISQWRPIMNGKTLLWLVPVFLILIALGCTQVRRIAVPLTALLVAVQLMACHSYFQTRWDEAFPEVASLLRAEAQPGDLIYLDAPWEEILLRYYGWPRDKLRVYAQSDPDGPDRWFRDFDGTLVSAFTVEQMEQGHRVWILTRANPAGHRALARLLSGRMSQVLNQKFGHGLMRNLALRNLELSLFVAKLE